MRPVEPLRPTVFAPLLALVLSLLPGLPGRATDPPRDGGVEVKAKRPRKARAVRVALDRRRYPAERYVLEGKERENFPRLGRDYEVLAPSTGGRKKPGAYNCIAWTLGITDRWVWPDPARGKYATVSDFDRLYGRYGFRRIDQLDYSVRPGVEKIVLYGKRLRSGKVRCTHGARQSRNGTWTSKIGGLARIRHLTPEALSGPSYGKPVAVYMRVKKAARSTSARPR